MLSEILTLLSKIETFQRHCDHVGANEILKLTKIASETELVRNPSQTSNIVGETVSLLKTLLRHRIYQTSDLASEIVHLS